MEEVVQSCLEALEPEVVTATGQLRNVIVSELQEKLLPHTAFTGSIVNFEVPRKMTLLEWTKEAKEQGAIVVIAGTWL